MSFTQQLFQLLSQSPGSIAYHIITLLAIQATLGLALWQRRQKPGDDFARRLVWASAGILVARLTIIFLVLLVGEPVDAVKILPPIERAGDAVTVVLILWALAPQSRSLPHLGDAILFIVLLVIALMYAFFAQEWAAVVASDTFSGAYSLSQQAAVWDFFQILMLSGGLLLIIWASEEQWSLRLIILAALLLAHVANALSRSVPLRADTEFVYWVRLGNLIALPTLAVLAYRHIQSQIVTDGGYREPPSNIVGRTLRLSQGIINNRQPEGRQHRALDLAIELTGAAYAALGILPAGEHDHLPLVGRRNQSGEEDKQESSDRYHTWALNLVDWPALRLAIQKHEQVELSPAGLGARQLRELGQELNIADLGSLLVEPLQLSEESIGVLLLAAESGTDHWSIRDRRLAKPVGDFLAQAISTEQIPEGSGNIHMEALEVEIESLRESLNESEAALAEQATTSQDVLDEEWVVRTVTHYSGDLENARERISQLEAILGEHSSGMPTIAKPSVVSQRDDIRQAIEEAVDKVRDQLLGKSLLLNLNVNSVLPPVTIRAADVQQIVTDLLENACALSSVEGRLTVNASGGSLPVEDSEESRNNQSFLHLSVTDSGINKKLNLYPYSIDNRYELSKSRAMVGPAQNKRRYLEVAQLVNAHGGRLWMSGDAYYGNTVSILLPAMYDDTVTRLNL
jgi:signal transduction histidine kinase